MGQPYSQIQDLHGKQMNSSRAQKYLRKNLPNDQLHKARQISDERAGASGYHSIYIDQNDRDNRYSYQFKLRFSNDEHKIARAAAAGYSPNQRKYTEIEAVLARQLLLDQQASAELPPLPRSTMRLNQFAELVERILKRHPDFEADRTAAYKELQDLTRKYRFERFLPAASESGSTAQGLIAALRTEADRLNNLPQRLGSYPVNPAGELEPVDETMLLAPEDIAEFLDQTSAAQSPYTWESPRLKR